MAGKSLSNHNQQALVHAVFRGLAELNTRPDGLRYFSLGEMDLAKVRDVYLRWLPSRLRRQLAEVIVHGMMGVALWKQRGARGVVWDQSLRPAAAAEVSINTLQRLDRAAKGKQQRKL